MNRKNNQQKDTDKGEKASSDTIGIGALLRDAREKKALDYAQISEITRVRPHILETLENEEWEKIPSPVFALGFIRSYARALGLDEEEIVSLYQKAGPVQPAPLKPLQGIGRRKKLLPVALGALLLVMIISVYYLWKEDTLQRRAPVTYENPDVLLKAHQEPRGIQKAPENNKPLVPQQNESVSQAETDRAGIDIGFPDGPARTEEEGNSPTENTLTAHVKETTWVRIFVDDLDPKEYVFKEGSRPQWGAKNGFELLIGNAGGIDFVFNGKEVKNLGKPGQVIRLILPENFKKRSSLE